MASGQCNVKAYNRRLRDLIHRGKANPSFIVSHELPLAEAPSAYKHFDDRDHGWTKTHSEPSLADDPANRKIDRRLAGPFGEPINSAGG